MELNNVQIVSRSGYSWTSFSFDKQGRYYAGDIAIVI